MRVTNAMMMNQALKDLGGLREKYAKAQAAVNGRALERPSEDPQRVVEAMDLSGMKIRLERSKRAGEDATEWLSVTETRMTAILDRLQGARESVIQSGSTGTLEPGARESLAHTLTAIRDSLMQELNGRHRDQYIFGGRHTDVPPFQLAPDGSAPYAPPVDPTNPTDGEVTRDVAPGLSVPINIPGNKLMAKGDFILTLSNMVQHLQSDQVGKVIGDDLKQLDLEMGNLTVLRSDLGIRQNQVEQFSDYAQTHLLDIEDRLSKISGVDLETAVLRMTEAATSYQAAVATFAKTLPTSLLDYLR